MTARPRMVALFAARDPGRARLAVALAVAAGALASALLGMTVINAFHAEKGFLAMSLFLSVMTGNMVKDREHAPGAHRRLHPRNGRGHLGSAFRTQSRGNRLDVLHGLLLHDIHETHHRRVAGVSADQCRSRRHAGDRSRRSGAEATAPRDRGAAEGIAGGVRRRRSCRDAFPQDQGTACVDGPARRGRPRDHRVAAALPHSADHRHGRTGVCGAGARCPRRHRRDCIRTRTRCDGGIRYRVGACRGAAAGGPRRARVDR